jgi:hypothetical protein
MTKETPTELNDDEISCVIDGVKYTQKWVSYEMYMKLKRELADITKEQECNFKVWLDKETYYKEQLASCIPKAKVQELIIGLEDYKRNRINSNCFSGEIFSIDLSINRIKSLLSGMGEK